MLNTAIELNETQNKKLALGYWMNNSTRSSNQLNKLWATGGGVKMNMIDMMHYMELQLNSEDPIVYESHKVLYEEGMALKIAYFWRVWNDKYVHPTIIMEERVAPKIGFSFFQIINWAYL